MRKLYPEELEGLSQEFISYLIMNGIDSDEWKKIKSDKPIVAEEIIEKFSYNYFNVMIQGIGFVTLKTSRSIHSIQFRKNNRSEFLFIQEDAKVGYLEKPYEKEKELEIFELLEQGFVPDKGTFYKELALLYAKSQLS